MVTTVESEWDEDQQALMLALAHYRESLCTDCGGDLNETANIENEFNYTADGPYLCWGCQAIGRARDRYVETHPKVHFANRWVLKKR